MKTNVAKISYKPPKKQPEKIIFLIDASHSMLGQQQLGFLKGLILKSLKKRFKAVFSVVVMQENTAKILQPFTDDLKTVSETVENIACSGKTNLYTGFEKVHSLLISAKNTPITLYIFTDGRANIGAVNPFFDAVTFFNATLANRLKTNVIDTETAFVKIGMATILADKIGADCLPLHYFI